MPRVTRRSPIFDGQGQSLQFNTGTEDIQELIMANGIYDRFNMDWYNKFSRFGIIDPYNAVINAKEYIFVTKPDLCLLAGNGPSPILSNNTFFVDAIQRYRNVARQLQYSASRSDGPFMAILSNSVSSTLDLPGLSSEMIESAGNIYSTTIGYRGTSEKSDQDFDFNLEFEDTKYLDVYMLFKMCDEYEKLKWSGDLDFTKAHSNAWTNYIINKVLHDQVTIYKFIVGEDGYRIIYFARIVGCVPTSVPRDAFSDMSDTTVQKITVGWHGHFVRDMDPLIISQFNQIVSNRASGRSDLPLFNMSTHTMDGRWASTPYIDIQFVNDTKHGNHREYFLRWKV